MGHRSNLVIVQDGRASVRYDHWAGYNLSSHLVMGPEYTLRWVRWQESVDHEPRGGWLYDVFCDGAVTIDLDERHLVWFDMPTRTDLARRAVVADLLGRTWAGWTVRRAEEGIIDVADAAGVPGERCRHPLTRRMITSFPGRDVALREDPPGSGRWCPAEDTPHFSLVTVARGDRLAVSLIDHAHAAWLGSALVERVLTAPGAVRQDAGCVALRACHPQGGVHVDLDAQRMRYWSTRDTYGLAEHVAQLWGPDIDVAVLAGGVIEHLGITGGFVECDALDLVAAAADLFAEVTKTHGLGGPHPATQALDALAAIFGEVPPGVNPAIADHHPLAATVAELAVVAKHLAELVERYKADQPGPA